MTFTVRTHVEIRAQILADWRTKYRNRGWDLDVSEGSDAYNWADAVAFQQEGNEARALQLTREMFPHTASSAFLLEHGNVIGMVRKAATKARLSVTVAGTGAWTTADRLVSTSGAQYAPIAGGSKPPDTTVTVEALVAGTLGNLAVADPIAWNPAPSGITANTVVAAVVVVARDEESDADYAQRILAYWRERPGGGNRADWTDWAGTVAGVEAAFTYPLLHTTLGPNTPGSVTVCVMQPMPAAVNGAGELLASNSRIVSGDVTDEVKDLFVGTGAYEDAGGKAPAVIDPDDIFVVPVQETAQAVDVEVTNEPGVTYEFPFAAPLAYTLGDATTVTVASVPAGLAIGKLIAVPDNAVRGLYAYRAVTNLTGSGPYVVTFAAVGTPSATGSILPLPSNANAIRTKVFTVFDALGPGAGTGRSLRWPRASGKRYPSTLYRGSLTAALMGVPGVTEDPPVAGVTSVDVELVGAVNPDRVDPGAKIIVKCGALRILEAP